MLSPKPLIYFFSILMLFLSSEVLNIEASRDPKTLRKTLRSFGMGPWCVGCPDHFCDDDLNIIQGYCCGCARFTDYLPINCPLPFQCPLNNYQLCLKYEYMMHCCC
ncbi:hypothetical protein ABEB36_003353 [Hypothenemus hampei]|uniref:Uncharacterized protein n=1 Tax=Hypothenemus hampei TaxID=57062 RepID=A0ABD1F8X3_HYPHA